MTDLESFKTEIRKSGVSPDGVTLCNCEVRFSGVGNRLLCRKSVFFVSDDGWQRHQLDLPLGEHQQPEPGHLGLGGQGGGQQGPGRHWQSGHDRGGGGGEEEAQSRKQGFILQQQRRFCHLLRGQIFHFCPIFTRFP